MAEEINQAVYNMMKRVFGRHRGSVARAEREWFAYGENPKKDIQDAMELAKMDREINPTGWTKSRLGMRIARVPLTVMISNPHLYRDKDARAKFLIDHPEFSSRGKGLK